MGKKYLKFYYLYNLFIYHYLLQFIFHYFFYNYIFIFD